jgi:hypothetical protein
MRKFTHSGQIWTAFLTIYAFKTNSALPATKPLPMSNSAHLHDLILLLFFLQFLLFRLIVSRYGPGPACLLIVRRVFRWQAGARLPFSNGSAGRLTPGRPGSLALSVRRSLKIFVDIERSGLYDNAP